MRYIFIVANVRPEEADSHCVVLKMNTFLTFESPFLDVLVSGVRYWTKAIDQASKKQHALDFDNIGVTDTSENISALDTSTKDLDVINRNTLALSWEFGDITNADGSGNFYITDFSSGSASIRDNYGWVGNISGYRHSGYGYGFTASKKVVDEKESIYISLLIQKKSILLIWLRLLPTKKRFSEFQKML